MEHDNPFDNPQERFYILRNAREQYSLWPHACALPPGWHAVSQPLDGAQCAAWLDTAWQTLRPAAIAAEQEA